MERVQPLAQGGWVGETSYFPKCPAPGQPNPKGLLELKTTSPPQSIWHPEGCHHGPYDTFHDPMLCLTWDQVRPILCLSAWLVLGKLAYVCREPSRGLCLLVPLQQVCLHLVGKTASLRSSCSSTAVWSSALTPPLGMLVFSTSRYKAPSLWH